MKPPSSFPLLPSTPSNISFHLGQVLQGGGDRFRISTLTAEVAVLELLETGQRKAVEIQFLQTAIATGEVCIERDQDHLRSIDPLVIQAVAGKKVTEAQLRTMVDKFKWLEAFRREGVQPDPSSARARLTHKKLSQGYLAQTTQFKLSTLMRANKAMMQAGGDAAALLPRFDDRGGRGRTRTDGYSESVLQAMVERERSSTTVRPAVELHQEVRRKIEVEMERTGTRIKVPSVSTVLRRLSAGLDSYEQTRKIVGKREADRRYRNSFARPRLDRPYLEIQIDDVDSGVFLIDDRTKLPFGRAYVTVGIDGYDLIPHGVIVGPDHRSTESAVGCILDGLLPKNPERPEYSEISKEWIGYGKAANYLMDNPPQNHANQLLGLQAKLNINFSWAKPHTPTEKTSVEHFNNVLKQKCFPRIPGWSDGKVAHDSVKRGMECAIMNASQFKQHLVYWIARAYLNEPGSDGLTPRQRRANSINPDVPRLLWTYEDIRLLRMVPQMATFRASGGVLISCLRYNNEDLMRLRRRIGHKAQVLIYVDPYDLSSIVAEHPESRALFKVPCIEPEEYTAGLTRRQQAQILKKAREMGQKNPDLNKCVKARNELAQMVERLSFDRRLRNRQKASQINLVPVDPGLVEAQEKRDKKNRNEIAEVPMTELEYQLMQLDQVDIGDVDWGVNDS